MSVGEAGERIGLSEVQTTSFNGRPRIPHTYKDNMHEDMLQYIKAKRIASLYITLQNQYR